jgi:hypothetical protein
MPLQDLENRIQKLQAFDFGQELETIVSENIDKLPTYIKEQLAAGRDGNDEPAKIFDRDTYSPATIEIKKAEGQGLGAVTDRITNYMTGEFYNSITERVEGQVFEADSDVSYFGDIRLRSSDALLNINERNRLDFAQTVTLPAIREALLTKTGLAITHG